MISFLKNLVLTSALIVGVLGFNQDASAEEELSKPEADSLEVSDTAAIVVVVETPDSALAAQQDTVDIEEHHRQDSPEDRGFLIVTSDGKSQLRIRGSIRLSAVHDFNGLQGQDAFSTHDIPVGAANKTEPRFIMTANQTRLGIEARRETVIGPVTMKIEGDFEGDANNFRLRHAYATTRVFLVGQTWSTFGDVGSIPWTVDLDGPNSSVAERSIQVRYSFELNDQYHMAVAIESPELEISLPDTLGGSVASDSLSYEPAYQAYPDFVARVRASYGWGNLQLAGVFRSITVRLINNDLNYLSGFGGLISGEIRPAETYEILFQAVYGSAISRYITALTGRNMDVIYNPFKDKYEVVPVAGGFVTLGHTWNGYFQSYLTAGFIKVDAESYFGDDYFKNSGYVSANVSWVPVSAIRIGVEYSYGNRVNLDGQSGSANRISAIIYYDF